VPVYLDGRQIGRATSGTWSPTLKKSIALGSVPAACSEPGARLGVEWTVEARRGTVDAIVTSLPFFDPERKRA
jgi:aminomethyltransferase